MSKYFLRQRAALARIVPCASIIITCLLWLTGCYNRATEYQELIATHDKIVAHVSAVQCSNHHAFWYKFEYQGKVHSGRVPPGQQSCASARIGDPILVYFNPRDASVHTTWPPELAYDMARGFYFSEWSYFLLLIPFSFLGIFLRSKYRKSA